MSELNDTLLIGFFAVIEAFNDKLDGVIPDLSPLALYGLESPEGAVTGAYGQSNRRLLAKAAAHYLKEGKHVAEYSMSVPCARLRPNQTLYTDRGPGLNDIDTLNLMRLDKHWRPVLRGIWIDILTKKGVTGSDLDYEIKMFGNATRLPQYTGELIRHPFLKHFKNVIYNVNTGNELITVATYLGLPDDLWLVPTLDPAKKVLLTDALSVQTNRQATPDSDT